MPINKTITEAPYISILPKITGEFPSVRTLPETLRGFIQEREDEFQKNQIPASIFWNEPIIPDNAGAFIQWLDRINYWIVEFRKDEPSRAFYFLNKILTQSIRFPEVSKTAIYFRFLGEWIKSGTHAANYLPISTRLQHLDPVISYHISRLTQGKDLFDDTGNPLEIEITEGMYREYRDKILNVITYLCEYYRSTGNYAKVQILLRKGCRLSEILHAAQKKFDFITLEILSELESENIDVSELSNLFGLAGTKGLIELDKSYGLKWKKYTEQSITQLQTRKLLYRIKRVTKDDILSTVSIIKDRELLLNGIILDDEYLSIIESSKEFEAKLNDEDRTILDRVEMLAHIWFKSLQKDTEKLLKIRQDFPKEFEILMKFQGTIIARGFSFETRINEPNARLFLGSFIDLFDFKVNSLQKGEVIKDDLIDLLINIYLIGMGNGNESKSLQMFSSLPYYKKFEQAGKNFFRHFDGNIPNSKEQLSEGIKTIIEKKDKDARRSFEKKLKFLDKQWNTIVSIEAANIVDGKQQTSKEIKKASKRNPETDKPNIFEIEFEKRVYQITVYTRKTALEQEEVEKLQDSLMSMMPYIHNLFIRELVLKTIKSAQHDMRTALEVSINGLEFVSKKVDAVRESCNTIISRTNDEGIRTLARNMIKDIDFIGRLSSGVSKNLGIGSTAFAKVRDGVEGIFSEPENMQYSKKSENITDFINNIYSGGFSRDITLSILRDTTKEYIAPIKQDDFFGVITNIFQNAIRYKKDEQVQGILNISFKSENGYLILVFHDFGKGIRDIDIDACLGKREFATEKPHKDSQRVGFSSVRDTIKKHNGKINIESNRSLVESGISKDETYTKIIIEIPLKSS